MAKGHITRETSHNHRSKLDSNPHLGCLQHSVLTTAPQACPALKII